ncbi:MAG TPA: S9 family peptidase [Chthoniobacteraceae bacterium]|nr:S9 family peptidase [Chthoniobacteraceae bacterium]
MRFAFFVLPFVSGALVAQIPENLVADGVAPLPPELREEAQRYLEFRSAMLQGWHPQRREMLISTRFADSSQLHLVKMPGGARRQLTFSTEPIATGSFVPKTGEFFVFARDTGGGEFFQFFRYDFADGRSTLLTDGKSRNSGARWARSGKQLAYASTRRTGKETDIYALDPRDSKTDRLLLERSSGGWSVSDWSDDETQLLLTEYVSANESHVHLFEVASGKVTSLTPEKAVHAGAKFARDGKGVFFVSDEESEFTRLVRLDLAGGAPAVLTGELPWNVEEFDISPDGKTIAFITNEDGIGVLRLFDVAQNRESPRPKIPVGVPAGLEWHENGRDLGFTLDAARSARDAYSLDVTTGEVTRWTESETGGLDPQAFVDPRLVKFPSFDGLQISAFVYAPDAAKFPGPRPVLVNIHGGPEGQARPDFLGRYNYFVNELGCAVIFPNVRGSNGYGKRFLTLDNGMKREDSVRDIGALLDWIKTQPDLDASRVCVTGGSYGGYMVLASLTHFSDRLRCGIDVVGISNFVSFLQNTQDYRRDLRRVEYGDERDPAMAEFLTKIAPLNNVAKITRPLFVVQGQNDPRVPVTEAEQIVKALRAQGGTCWYLLAKDEGHGFAKKKNADFQFLAQILFLREHLLNPAPPKTAEFGFDDWLIVPLRIHLVASKDTPALRTTLNDDDLARIVPKINRVWAQAGIRFCVESIVREEALPLKNADVPRRDELPARMPSEIRSAAAFNIYYVKRLDVNGFYMADGIFVKDTASLRPVEGGIDEPIPRVTSHELGHAFSLPHRQDRTNLMASGTTGTLLNDAEIERARAAARKFSWIESAEALLKRADELHAGDRSSEARKWYRTLATLPHAPTRVLERSRE